MGDPEISNSVMCLSKDCAVPVRNVKDFNFKRHLLHRFPKKLNRISFLDTRYFGFPIYLVYLFIYLHISDACL